MGAERIELVGESQETNSVGKTRIKSALNMRFVSQIGFNSCYQILTLFKSLLLKPCHSFNPGQETAISEVEGAFGSCEPSFLSPRVALGLRPLKHQGVDVICFFRPTSESARL